MPLLDMSVDDVSLLASVYPDRSEWARISYDGANLNVPTDLADKVAAINIAAARTAALSAYATSKRFEKEVGGMVSQTFGPLYTDRDTRGLMGQAIQSIDLGLIQPPINWKAASGFIELDRATLVAISSEVATFVQSTFDKESEVDGMIAAGTITVRAQIDAAFAAI